MEKLGLTKLEDNKEYKNWLSDFSRKYKNSQIKASCSVNYVMISFFWEIGRDLTKIHQNYAWGSHFFEQISKDLKKMLPDVKSFSPRNLQYMCQFYSLYPELKIANQFDSQLDNAEITNQLDSQFIFSIPWGHHKVIMSKCKGDTEKARFYIKKVRENNWSRAVLLNFIDTDLYERQGKAISNFKEALESPQGDLAQEITRDPYNFDFLSISEKYNEKELKDALMDNLKNFLLELGTGFAFVGREYRLIVGQTEQYIDMLFYNITLHCYIVIEVKITEFDPRDMGQLGTYVAAVDGILRKDGDNPTIGLLICKTKDDVLAQYAVNNLKSPIGISEYELANLMPAEFKNTLPTIEEIENELK